MDAGAELKNPQLYSSASFLTATHCTPQTILGYEPFAQWLAAQDAFRDQIGRRGSGVSRLDTRVSRIDRQAIRRWRSGSAASFEVMDRITCAIGAPLTHLSMDQEGWLVRNALMASPGHVVSMWGRVLLVEAVEELAEAVAEIGLDAFLIA